MSYNGKVDFGLLGDYDAMPDIDAFAAHLDESLAELLAAARQRREGEREVERAQEGRHAGHGAEEDDHVVNTARVGPVDIVYETIGDPVGSAAAARHGARDAADPLGPRAVRAARGARLPRDPVRQPRRGPLHQDRGARRPNVLAAAWPACRAGAVPPRPTWPPTPSGCSTTSASSAAHVVGASMGGMIAQQLAIRRRSGCSRWRRSCPRPATAAWAAEAERVERADPPRPAATGTRTSSTSCACSG